MIKAFKMPDLGEGIHEVEILSVPVSVGDNVKEGDTILELETDKAAVEIPSPYTGVVEEILVAAGQTVKVGEVVMTFRTEGAAPAERGKAEGLPTEERGEKIPQRRPPEEKPPEPFQPKEEGPEKEGPKREGPVPASPATRRLARELGVDLTQVAPTGPAGQVTSEDVRAFAEGKGKKKPEERPEEIREEVRPSAVTVPKLPDFSRWGPVERVPLRSIRKATARQMALTWSQIPHVSNHDLADITELEAFRKKHKGEIEAKGGKLTHTIFALKAAATALKAFPRFNASLDTEAGEIILKHYYHVGIAVATEDGLIVPVIRDVDRKSILDLSLELKDLAERTRQRKVGLEELHGGTFTITNVGPMGGGQFVPVINYPQVAILGMGAAAMQPKVVKSAGGPLEIVPRLLMPLVLCIDHRVLDGADAVPFMRMIVEALEDPDALFMMMT
ncbi:MAG: 2-oxo acid dehydrogenase subunit E2 [Deltaproteobacteria bacterium]|nr:2-oxo acid dehydrogenase subunit E2 [Deltaproteobacteria bacterium]